MSELVSVVIPVYNVEPYLSRCIESVISQTYKKLEIILVDDGSSDNSGNICDKYSEQDSRICVIHKKNGGLSDARNAGIDIAKGNYITFVDSDDYISIDYIEYLYTLLTKYSADISICLHRKFDENHPIDSNALSTVPSKTLLFDGKEAVLNLCYQKGITISACGKLYKAELFTQCRYPVGKLYEDLGTTYKLLLMSKKIVFSNQEKYYYYQRTNSIMHYNFSKRNMDRILLSEQLYHDVKDISADLKKAATARLFISNIQVLRELPFNDFQYADEQKIICKNIKLYRNDVICNSQVKLINRIIALSTYFGIRFTQRLGSLYKKVYRN